ncbi:hypothetical protein A9Q86_16185 [Flavobacteriales bacterium 33_180_T64]|nr:hypothetical protein A9Q86_16185 [Flavobacteriales bacterium 33_180_T64]
MNCKNCHTELISNSDFCNICGGKVIRNRLTFKNLFEHISETFFNYDNKLLRTLNDLFIKPETVIEGYINGIRKRYVNPISYFGLALTFGGLYLLFLNKFYPEALDFSNFVMKGQEEFQKKNMSIAQEYQSILMMFYIPIYALIARITFIGLNKFNYTELLVVFMYWQAQMSIVSAIIIVLSAMFGITAGIMTMIFIPVMMLYCAYILKRLYQLSFWEIILRSLLFVVILGIFMLFFGILFAIAMYFDSDFRQLLENQKAVTEVIDLNRFRF